jgi:GntR family transcriptional regulator, sialic acid-inducible nan operon repressor
MLSFDITPIRRRKIYEELVEQLVEVIVSGRAPPGTLLPSERELVDQFGVGRSSVREALFALQKMGLIALNNGERASVIEPTSASFVGELAGPVRYYLSRSSGVRHFQDAREFLEAGLARYAAKNASSDDIVRLERALMANRVSVGDTERFIDTDVAFHNVLADISGNPIFKTLSSALASWLRDQRAASVGRPGSPEAAVVAHTRIFEAISAHDADLAETAMRDHLRQVVNFYWSANDGANQ